MPGERNQTLVGNGNISNEIDAGALQADTEVSMNDDGVELANGLERNRRQAKTRKRKVDQRRKRKESEELLQEEDDMTTSDDRAFADDDLSEETREKDEQKARKGSSGIRTHRGDKRTAGEKLRSSLTKLNSGDQQKHNWQRHNHYRHNNVHNQHHNEDNANMPTQTDNETQHQHHDENSKKMSTQTHETQHQHHDEESENVPAHAHHEALRQHNGDNAPTHSHHETQHQRHDENSNNMPAETHHKNQHQYVDVNKATQYQHHDQNSNVVSTPMHNEEQHEHHDEGIENIPTHNHDHEMQRQHHRDHDRNSENVPTQVHHEKHHPNRNGNSENVPAETHRERQYQHHDDKSGTIPTQAHHESQHKNNDENSENVPQWTHHRTRHHQDGNSGNAPTQTHRDKQHHHQNGNNAKLQTHVHKTHHPNHRGPLNDSPMNIAVEEAVENAKENIGKSEMKHNHEKTSTAHGHKTGNMEVKVVEKGTAAKEHEVSPTTAPEKDNMAMETTNNHHREHHEANAPNNNEETAEENEQMINAEETGNNAIHKGNDKQTNHHEAHELYNNRESSDSHHDHDHEAHESYVHHGSRKSKVPENEKDRRTEHAAAKETPVVMQQHTSLSDSTGESEHDEEVKKYREHKSKASQSGKHDLIEAKEASAVTQQDTSNSDHTVDNKHDKEVEKHRKHHSKHGHQHGGQHEGKTVKRAATTKAPVRRAATTKAPVSTEVNKIPTLMTEATIIPTTQTTVRNETSNLSSRAAVTEIPSAAIIESIPEEKEQVIVETEAQMGQKDPQIHEKPERNEENDVGESTNDFGDSQGVVSELPRADDNSNDEESYEEQDETEQNDNFASEIEKDLKEEPENGAKDVVTDNDEEYFAEQDETKQNFNEAEIQEQLDEEIKSDFGQENVIEQDRIEQNEEIAEEGTGDYGLENVIEQEETAMSGVHGEAAGHENEAMSLGDQDQLEDDNQSGVERLESNYEEGIDESQAAITQIDMNDDTESVSEEIYDKIQDDKGIKVTNDNEEEMNNYDHLRKPTEEQNEKQDVFIYDGKQYESSEWRDLETYLLHDVPEYDVIHKQWVGLVTERVYYVGERPNYVQDEDENAGAEMGEIVKTLGDKPVDSVSQEETVSFDEQNDSLELAQYRGGDSLMENYDAYQYKR